MPKEETYDRPLPSSPNTECAALCSVLLNNSLVDEAVASWSLEDFHVSINRDIFAVMLELHREQMPFDMIVVADRLRARGKGEQLVYLSDMSHGVPASVNLKAYTRVLKEKSAARKGIKEATAIMAALYDEEEAQIVIGQAADRFSAMRETSGNGHQGGQLIELARQVTDHLYTIKAGINTAIPTGLADLDRLTAGGIRPGELWGIAARSSRGKSSILVQILLNMAKAGKPVVLFSLETQAISVALRILAAETGVALNSLRAPGALRESEIDELLRQVNEKFNVPMWIFTKGFKPVQEIKRKIHSLNRTLEKPIVAVGIDWYAKLQSSQRHENRTQALKYIADYLQNDIAIDEEVALCVPAQFNRSGWAANEPGPANIDGGEAYHDACDMFAVLDTSAASKERMSKAKLTVYKQRNGPVALGKDHLKLLFDRIKLQFVPRAEDLGEEVPDKGDWQSPSDSPERKPVSPGAYISEERERADFL